jgi:hypothetical protein
VLVKDTGVGAHLKSCNTTIEATHAAKSSNKGNHLSEFSNISALSDLLTLQHKILININCIGVEPCNVLAVGNSGEHISAIVPLERINHVLNLVDFGLVDQGQEHVAVAVNKAHFTLAGHVNLVQFHFHNFGRVLDLSGFKLSAHNVKNTNSLRSNRVNQSQNITR